MPEDTYRNEANDTAMRHIESVFSETMPSILDILADCREKSLVATKLEEAEMWARKCIAEGNHKIEIRYTADASLKAL